MKVRSSDRLLKPSDLDRPTSNRPAPDPGKTLMRAVAILVMLAIAIVGALYSARLIAHWSGSK
jgi:hypothetical protein